MNDLGQIHQKMKRYYIEASLSSSSHEELKKGVQAIGVCLLYFENSIENEFIIRDTRNFIYDIIKTLPNKTSKKMVKDLLKIVK